MYVNKTDANTRKSQQALKKMAQERLAKKNPNPMLSSKVNIFSKECKEKSSTRQTFKGRC